MKKVLMLMILVGSLAAACSKDKNKIWDSNAMVSLRPEAGVKSTFEGTLSAREIVEKATQIEFWYHEYNIPTGRGFADSQRDLTNNRLLMWGSDVIHPEHGLVPFFIECTDLVFTIVNEVSKPMTVDTIAYIPNATLRAAEKIIKAAYVAEDYETCYTTFDNAWRFIPITGPQWRELKKQGKQ